MRLPERYQVNWLGDFNRAVDDYLRPGMRVLDVGGGRRPTIGVERRPPGVTYVGLDPDADELAIAGGSYDQLILGGIEDLDCSEVEPFDLVVSWQVLEHVPDVAAALDRMREVLGPGGMMAAQFSGANAIYAYANRLMPGWLARFAMHRLLGRDPDTVFHAHYDRCTYEEIRSLMTTWSEASIVCRYKAGDYLGWAPPLKWLYLRYEAWALRHPQLATHYEVYARK